MLTAERDSPPARILQLASAGALRFLLSEELLAEYRDVLTREHIRDRHKRTLQQIDELLEQLETQSDFREPARESIEGPDPNDAHLWMLLRTEARSTLITGDKALLRDPPSGAKVATPRDWALAHLRSSG